MGDNFTYQFAWAAPVDLAGILADLRVIADDSLYRRPNSLCLR